MTKTFQYRRASNRVKAEVRKAVRDFENRIATEVQANPKGFLKYANGNRFRCQSRGPKHVPRKCFHTRRLGKTTRIRKETV